MKFAPLFTTALVVCAVVCAPIAHAASPSPSASASARAITTATPSAIQDPAVQQNIKDRIERILDEKTDEAKDSLKKRAFVGRVERVTTEFLTLSTLGGSVTVRMPPTAVILSFPKLSPLKTSDIEIDGFAMAMGTIQNDVMEAKRILISTTSLFPTRKKAVIGTVQKVTTTSITLSTKNGDEVIPVSRRTQYEDVDGATLTRTSIKADFNVIALFQDASEASGAANLVRVLK